MTGIYQGRNLEMITTSELIILTRRMGAEEIEGTRGRGHA